MKYSIFRLTLIWFCLSLSVSAFSTHIAGGNISYTTTCIPNQYLVSLTLYRDCAGAPIPQSIAIDITNDCGLSNPSLILPIFTSAETSQVCANALQNSACNGGNLPGYETHIYSGLVSLPDTCDSWTFAYRVCNRNTGMVNVSSTSCLYIETTLNSATEASNSSVIVNPIPVPMVCNGLAVSYNYNAHDINGDSLTYTLIDALNDVGDPVTYVTPYTGAQPIPGISLDPVTGQISFTSVADGGYIVTVLIEEYNSCGELVGSLIHDTQFFVQSCANTPPSPPVSITNFNSFGTNASLSGNTIGLCDGDEFCFDLVFTDNDANDTLNILSDISTILPGATLTQTGTNPLTATVCWAYQPGHLGNVISIAAYDQACPIQGFTQYSVLLDLPPSYYAGNNASISLCAPNLEYNLNCIIGFHHPEGNWYDANGSPIHPIVNTDTLASGTYMYITDPALIGGCNINLNCAISDTAFVTVTASTLGISNLNSMPTTGASDGSVSAQAVGGVPPYTYQWLNLGNQTTYNGNTWLNLDAGDYAVLITDTIGCTVSDTISVGWLGLENLSDHQNIRVYPTLISDGLLYINHQDQADGLTLKIYDLNGRVLLDKVILKGQQSITLNLANGLYQYQIVRPNATEPLKTGKIILAQ